MSSRKSEYCKSSLSILGDSLRNLYQHLKNIHLSTSLTIERQTVTGPKSDINLDKQFKDKTGDLIYVQALEIQLMSIPFKNNATNFM